KSRASLLNDTPDSAAVVARAGPALAVIDAEAVLEIAEIARGAGEIADRRASGLDRLRQHRFDRVDQAGRLFRLQGRRLAPRAEPGPPQGLADIDVAEPGDPG